jgi:hypothetical protein
LRHSDCSDKEGIVASAKRIPMSALVQSVRAATTPQHRSRIRTHIDADSEQQHIGASEMATATKVIKSVSSKSTDEGTVANVRDDGELVRRGVTIRRSIEHVRRAWAGAGIEGDVEFDEAPGGLGTEVRVTAPASHQSALKEIVGAWRSDDPGDSLSTQLRQFKAVLETGEVATTKGQPSGREAKSE